MLTKLYQKNGASENLRKNLADHLAEIKVNGCSQNSRNAVELFERRNDQDIRS